MLYQIVTFFFFKWHLYLANSNTKHATALNGSVKMMNLLLGPHISSSAARKVNVEISTRHPVCVVATHSAGSVQKIFIRVGKL